MPPFNAFRRWLAKGSSRRTLPAGRPRLGVEALEGRTTPALAFNFTLNDPGNQFAPFPLLMNNLRAAGDILSGLLNGKGSLEVQVNVDTTLATATGGAAAVVGLGTSNGLALVEGGPINEAKTGTDPNGAAPDMVINLNPRNLGTTYWFDPSGAARTAPVATDRTDFLSTILHELTHGLGFNGYRSRSGATYGTFPQNTFDTFDQLTQFGAGGGDPSVLYFTGSKAVAAYGKPVPLTSLGANDPFAASNFSHLGNPAGRPGSDLIPDLMNGIVFFNGTRYRPSQLDLAVLADLGWSLASAADVAGPNVSSAAFTGAAANTFDKVTLTFSEAVRPATVNATNVLVTGPNGSIPVAAITEVAGSGETKFDVTFAPQTASGTYTLTAGVGVLDLAGNPLDQNKNGASGETPGDLFMAADKIAARSARGIFAVGGADGTVRIVDATNGTVISTTRPLDDGSRRYAGVVQTALADFTGDGVADLVVAAADPEGSNGLSGSKAGLVFLYDGAALLERGADVLVHAYTPFASTDGPAGTTGDYINGLNVAAADVNGDGQVDLIAGTRGGNGTTAGRIEYGRLVVIDGTPDGSDRVLGGVQKPFGPAYQKGVVVAAGNPEGVGGAEVAVTRGGPVASANPDVQRVKLKVLVLQGSTLTELRLAADGSAALAPFAAVGGPANAISRDARVAFADIDGDGKAELVFSALDPLTDPSNKKVRVAAFAIDIGASKGAARIVSTGPDAGTYLAGESVADHAITHVAGTGTSQNLALLTQSGTSGLVYLDPKTGVVRVGGFSLPIVNGGVTVDAS